MKIRTAFVANSSSSSFVCEVCGHIRSGWDLSLSEADMVECYEGHVFCMKHLLVPFEEIPETQEDSDVYDEEVAMDFCIPSKYCPICQMKSFSTYDTDKYLRKIKTIEEVKAEFGTYENFKKFLKGK